MPIEKKSTYKGYTDARARANKKWSEKQSQIAIRIKPEIKQSIDAHIAITGESIAAFICRAVAEQIERDNSKNA